ncbi:MAG TPA: prepilin-type N-terminal cleavage/methylation domain-containing protein [Candidatus Angelobacter sp.]|nr:prepilin-type N-terminal cleavage/methylation domain-containing protein [Candidatus Angelobacter sp.]
MRGVDSGRQRNRAFTLVEMLVTMAIGLVVGAAIVMLYFCVSRSFLTLDNYADMNQASQLALDKMSKDIRQAKQITAFTTNSITFSDVNGNPLEFSYDSNARTLSRISGGTTKTYLTNCDSLQFWIYQPVPMSNSFACYTPAYVTNARVVQITWACSRPIMGLKTTTESMESAQIAMRNH